MKNWLKIIFSMMFLFGYVIAILVLFIIFFNINFYWVIVGNLFLDFLMSILVFFSKRRSEVKLSWIVFIIFVPFIGFWSYIFFGKKYFYNKEKEIYYKNLNNNEFKIYKKENNNNLRIINKETPNLIKPFLFINKECNKPIYTNNNIDVLVNGTIAFNKILNDIKKAKYYILLNYFIIADGELFEVFYEIIYEKISEGLKIYLIYDYVGSYFKISNKNLHKLKKIGVHIKKYLPIVMPFLNKSANYRNHRKDIVIDGVIAYTGGMNLEDLYINKSEKFGLFHDIQIRIEGESVRAIELIFVNDWNFVTKYKERITELVPKVLSFKKFDFNSKMLVQIFNDTPNSLRSINEELYILLINSAKKRIWLSTPYFIPPNELILALKLAASVGIDVRLTISGLTDKIFILDLTKLYCKELIEAGVKVYEMNNVFNHSKIAIIDDDVVVIGTCNLDYRSLFSDHQTTVLIYNKKIVKLFEKRCLWDYQHSILLKDCTIKYKSLSYRFFLSFLKIISPIL